MRSGAQTLLLLSTPLNVPILRALAEGPKQQVELRRATGSPAQTTLRAQLKRLNEIGVIEKERRNRFPGVLEYELSAAGRDLLFVADTLESWLGRAPEAPLPLAGNAARSAIKALAEGWSTTMLRALAPGPLSLTELDRVIAALSYPSLERRLAALRLTGQVEACSGNGRSTPYALTGWTRLGIGPLVAAARWERRHMPKGTAPIGRIDVETAFLLTIPSLRLPVELSGGCRIAVEIRDGAKHRLSGVEVEVRDGEIAACSTQLTGSPDARVSGSPSVWLASVIDHDPVGLDLGGDKALARAVVNGLHNALFAPSVRH